MNSFLPSRTRWVLVSLFALGALLFGGCLEQRLIWAPDGSRAVVITKDGLYLCGADGAISDLLMPNVYAAAWAGDAEHLVLARSRDLKDSASIASALGQARADEIAAKAELVWHQVQAAHSAEDVTKQENTDIAAEIVYLRENHADDLHKLLGKDWDEAQETPATLNSLISARVVDGKIEMGPVLYQEITGIVDIRTAPGAKVVAFVTRMDSISDKNFAGNDFRTYVAPLDGSTPAALVAEHTAASPDWMPEGRGLAYLQASGGPSNGEDLRLGALVERMVIDAAGMIHLAEVSGDQQQVGLILQPFSRVRCLKDGRVIFDATEFHLPIPKRDQPGEEQLFVMSPSQHPTVKPLLSLAERKKMSTNVLSSFELSPDGSQLLVGGDSGEVWLVTPDDDKVEAISGKLAPQHVIAPVWRGPGEFSYARAVAPAPGSKAPPGAEVVLHTGKGDTILSRTWSPALMTQFIY